MNHNLLLQCPPASLLKQLIAMLYDSILIIAILFIATAILLPFNQGEAVGGIFYSIYLLLLVFIFYGWFWRKSGQTLGMKVWKIKIINLYGYNPSWPVCFLRLSFATLPPVFFIALNRYFIFTQDSKFEILIAITFFLIGYLWRLFTPYTWHDHLSNTRIISVSKIALDNKQ